MVCQRYAIIERDTEFPGYEAWIRQSGKRAYFQMDAAMVQ
jgi:hypothetical protein